MDPRVSELDGTGTWAEVRHGPESGRVVGDYRLSALLGHGGASRVYLGIAESSGRPSAAVKVLLGAERDPDFARRFTVEVDALRRLEHPEIVALQEFGVTRDGLHYLVTELIDGVDLKSWCRELEGRRGSGPNPSPPQLQLLTRLCRVVGRAHAAGITHRDLKPSNILVTREGALKVLDFGVAKILAAGSTTLATRTGLLPVTPEYASPEQVASGDTGPTCDVYALGLLLYEGLLQRRAQAFEPLPQGLGVRLQCHAQSPGSAAAFRRKFGRRGEGLAAIVRRATRPRPHLRYPNADALADDLERWQRGLRTDAERQRAPAMWGRAALLVAVTGALAWGWRPSATDSQPPASPPVADPIDHLVAAAKKGVEGDPKHDRRAIVHSFTEAVMQVPDDPRIGFELLGHVANKALSGGYYRDAVTLYRQAVARAQRHGATHPFTQGRTRELIAALLNDGDLRAAQALTRELDVSSGAATSTRTLNVALLARVASMMGEHSTALAHLDGLRDGGHLHTTQTCRTRVNVLRELDRLAEAESAVEECVGPTAESENPRALVTRGYLELARGHAARALEFFNGALDLQLQRARYDHLHVRYTHNAIARANAALGLIDQARAQATFVLESSDPGLTRNDLANAVAFEVLAELALLGGDAASGRANVMRARGLWHAALGRREHPRLRALDALDRWADRLS